MDNIKLFIGGPSFGKTSLLFEYYKKLSKNKNCIILYSSCNEEDTLNSEIYKTYPKNAEIDNPRFIDKNYLKSLNKEVILIDEIQNRTNEEIDNIVNYCDKNDIICYLFGTMFDIYGHIIPNMKYIIELGISFELIKRKCCECDNIAFNTIHIDKNNNILLSPINCNEDDYKILILCRKCYNKYMKKLKIF